MIAPALGGLAGFDRFFYGARVEVERRDRRRSNHLIAKESFRSIAP